MVGYSDTVRIASQVMQNMFWSAKRGLGVDNPVLLRQGVQKRIKGRFVGQSFAFSMKGQLAFIIRLAQYIDELTAKYLAENLYWQQESVSQRNPSGVIGRKSAGRNNEVDMGMTVHYLSPGVQNSEKADVGSKMFRIGCYFQKSGCGGLEHKTEQDLLVLPHQGDQFVRNTKYQVVVLDRQQFSLPVVEPFVPGICLTLWTVPVSARVI